MMLRRPIAFRLKLTAWYVATLVILVLVFSAQTYLTVRSTLLHTLDLLAERDLSTLGIILKNEIKALPALEEHSAVPHFAIYRGDTLIYMSHTWNESGLVAAMQEATLGRPRIWRGPGGEVWHLKVKETPTEYRIAVAHDASDYHRTLDGLLVRLALGLGTTVLLAGIGGYWLAGRALKPVRSMADQARRITAQSLSERLAIANPRDEIGQLGTVFNTTLARLEASFAQLRNFTADASHQLRSPLAAIRTVGESGIREARTADQFRDVIASMLEESDRLAAIVDQLLVLTRAESGQMPLSRRRLSLRDLVSETVDTLLPLAEERGVEIGCRFEADAQVMADEAIVRQALINVLHNAICYTPPPGRITLSVMKTGGRPAIRVTDTGPGVSSEQRERIFDRFFRGTAGKEAAGTGLGLPIARWAMEVHGGRLDLLESSSSGSTFQLLFPEDE